MAIHLLSRTLVLAGYESGHVVLYAYEGPPDGVTDGRLPEVGSSDKRAGRGRWVQRWKVKGHNEAGALEPILAETGARGLALTPLYRPLRIAQ